jgi:hypothetical protein
MAEKVAYSTVTPSRAEHLSTEVAARTQPAGVKGEVHTVKTDNFPVVPTTKILAIGQFTKPPTPEQMKELFPKEVPATLRLYLAGKIDQWWIRQTQTGPVFLLNVTSVEEARALMEKLPLGQAGLMKHEFIELGPLAPLYLLLNDGGSTASK